MGLEDRYPLRCPKELSRVLQRAQRATEPLRASAGLGPKAQGYARALIMARLG